VQNWATRGGETLCVSVQQFLSRNQNLESKWKAILYYNKCRGKSVLVTDQNAEQSFRNEKIFTAILSKSVTLSTKKSNVQLAAKVLKT
jgi:hypothetical protein